MKNSATLGRALVFIGLFVALLGLVLVISPNIPFLGRLPGDILVEKGSFRFFFPIVTSLIFSLVFTIFINIVVRLLRR